MSEDVAVRIAEAVESIRDAIAAIEAFIIVFGIVFGLILLFCIITKD